MVSSAESVSSLVARVVSCGVVCAACWVSVDMTRKCCDSAAHILTVVGRESFVWTNIVFEIV